MIELTNESITQILSLQERDGFNYIRVGVTGGGCAGFEYVFDSSLDANADDTVIDYGKFSILIDNHSVQYVEGMTLDYVKEGLNSFFKFINPKEASACGCGVSVNFNIC